MNTIKSYNFLEDSSEDVFCVCLMLSKNLPADSVHSGFLSEHYEIYIVNMVNFSKFFEHNRFPKGRDSKILFWELGKVHTGMFCKNAGMDTVGEKPMKIQMLLQWIKTYVPDINATASTAQPNNDSRIAHREVSGAQDTPRSICGPWVEWRL